MGECRYVKETGKKRGELNVFEQRNNDNNFIIVRGAGQDKLAAR